MLEKIKAFLIDFISTIQAAKIYAADHPQLRELIERAFRNLEAVLKEKPEIVIGIVDNELAWEEEILFDLSRKLHSLFLYLKERGIERMSFEAPLGKDELSRFVAALTNPKIKDYEDPQEYLAEMGIQKIKAGRLTVPRLVPSADQKRQEDLQGQYEASVQGVTQSIESMLEGKALSSLDLGFSMLDIMDSFAGKSQKFLGLISIKEKDILTFAHLLNVSVLAMHLSSKMGYSKDEVLELGNAALFHDIGKLFVSRKILKKKDTLSKEEFSMIRDHTVLGARILLKYEGTLGILPAVVAFEHHLRYDLKGYPRLAFPYRPHPASFIVSLCDVYDALSQKRTYKKDFPPLQIYELLTKEKGKLLDPEVVDEFFRTMGVWPVGTIVVLNDERVAVVREANEQDIFRPKVEVIVPEDKREHIDLVEQKDRFEIKDYLNPYGEGRKYLDFI
jgi:putative nucleotidyltransferase with HDIG domain